MFLVCGEALFDLFLESEEGPASATYAARAGGSPFNVAIGLARLGEASGLLTGLSTDLLGQRLSAVLAAEGVSTAYAIETERPTTISLVGLDTAGVPAYQFYKNGSADTGVAPGDLPAIGPEVTGLHFGSYSLAAAPVADAFAVLAAGERHRFITLDPNVRPTVEPDMDVWRERLGRLYPLATLVKISAEDLELLHPGAAVESFAADLIGQGVALVVVTDGGEAAHGWTATGHHATATPPRVAGHRHRRGRRHLPGGADRAAAAMPTRGRRRPWPRWTPTRCTACSTSRRGPPPSPARGAGRTCRASPSSPTREPKAHGIDRHPGAALRPRDLRGDRRPFPSQDPAEPVPAHGRPPDAHRLADHRRRALEDDQGRVPQDRARGAGAVRRGEAAEARADRGIHQRHRLRGDRRDRRGRLGGARQAARREAEPHPGLLPVGGAVAVRAHRRAAGAGGHRHAARAGSSSRSRSGTTSPRRRR